MLGCRVLSGAGEAGVVVPRTGAAGSPGVAPPTSMTRFLTFEKFSETDPREVNLGVFDPWEWTGEVRLAIRGPEVGESWGAAGTGKRCTRGPENAESTNSSGGAVGAKTPSNGMGEVAVAAP